MTVLAWANMCDTWKPDSTDTNANGDRMTFSGANVTIDTATTLLAPSAGSLKLDMTGSKIAARAALGFGAPTSELAFGCAFKITGALTLVITAGLMIRQSTNATATGFDAQVIRNAATNKATIAFRYDGVTLFTTGDLVTGDVYRLGVYLKLGTLGVLNSTVKIYLDDINSGDIAVGAATSIFSSTTVNMANPPAIGTLYFGNTTGSGGWDFIMYVQHIWVIDTAAGGETAPVSRVLDPIRGTSGMRPTGAGFSAWATGTFADVNELIPNDATTFISQNITGGGGAAVRGSFAKTLWATAGNSNGDTPLAVRVSTRNREIPNPDLPYYVTFNVMMREGGVNTDGPNRSMTNANPWEIECASVANRGLPIQQTPPGSGGSWTVALVDGVEGGLMASDPGVGLLSAGKIVQAQCTWIRTDALFIAGAAIAVSAARAARSGVTPVGIGVGVF